jgi:hypothetical protein
MIPIGAALAFDRFHTFIIQELVSLSRHLFVVLTSRCFYATP